MVKVVRHWLPDLTHLRILETKTRIGSNYQSVQELNPCDADTYNLSEKNVTILKFFPGFKYWYAV